MVALLDRVWDLRDNLSAYDATYVALAEALDCALLIADGRLALAPGLRCPITVLKPWPILSKVAPEHPEGLPDQG